jgi:translation elongation factor EF-1beta
MRQLKCLCSQSVVTLEVKPWDDETDMKKLEESVRSVEQEGLVWGASKLVAVGYGVSKLQITLVIEDDLVSLDELQEKIQEFEDYVQSTDVAAMQSTLCTLRRVHTQLLTRFLHQSSDWWSCLVICLIWSRFLSVYV